MLATMKPPKPKPKSKPKPGTKPKRRMEKIPKAQELPKDFDFCSLHRKAEPPILTFDPKHKKPGTALAKRFDVPAVIDVPSTPAEKLSAGERKTLAHCEKTIARGAMAFLDTGDALTVIQEQRLYRERYGTFEAYLWEELHLEKSVAYRWIKHAATHTKASAIADKLSLSLTNEAQFRALETVTDAGDLQAVLRRAAKKITPDVKGFRVPTAKILTEAVKEEFTPEEDLKREKAERKAKAAQANGTTKLTHIVGGAPAVPASLLEVSADMPSEYSADSLPADGSDQNYWNGRPNRYAVRLHSFSGTVRDYIARFFSEPESHPYVASFLESIVSEIRHGKFIFPDTTPVRRAK
jgi:hypothetical protein